MSLKDLYLRQRISAAAAATATSPEARLAHRRLAAGYASRIADYDSLNEERYSSAASKRTSPVLVDGVPLDSSRGKAGQ